jgi:hypothetical protein
VQSSDGPRRETSGNAITGRQVSEIAAFDRWRPATEDVGAKRGVWTARSTQIDIGADDKSVEFFPRYAWHVDVKQFALQIQSDGSRTSLFVKPPAQSARIVFDRDPSQRKTCFILHDISSNRNHRLTTLF